MNKTGVMLMAVISLILASCDVDWDKLYPEIQNPSLDENYFVLTKTLPDNLEIKGNFDENTMVPLFDFEMMQFLKGDSVAFEMEISDDNYGSSKVSTIVNGNHVFAKGSDLLDIFQRKFHIEKPRDMYIRYIAYKTNSNDPNTRIGGYEKYFGETTVTVTLTIIEQAYYLVGNMNGWDYYNPLRFNHSDKDVYDDPVFTIDVIVPDNCSWKIMPKSYTDSWNGLFGVETEGDESTEGKLIKDGKSGMIAKSGWYRFTINLQDNKYNIEFLGDSSDSGDSGGSSDSGGSYLYIIGSNNGWTQTASQRLYTENYADYFGYASLDGEFKFTNAPDWTHTNYGAGAAEGTLSTDGGAGNLSVSAKGLYWCQVSTAALTYSLTQITTIGVIGDATSNGWVGSTALKATDDKMLIWEGDIAFSAGGEWKFLANDAWDINLAGSVDNLTQNGSNLATPGEGTKHVRLDLSTLPYTCTVK